MNLCYGKKPPKFNRKTLTLDEFTLPNLLPPPPEKRAWEYVISDARWAQTMFGNDVAGNCVEAAVLHFIMAATASAGRPATFVTQDAFDLYSAITGWDGVPGSPSDQGTYWTDALAYMVSTGITDQQGRLHKWLGWAAIDHTNLSKLRQGMNIFDGILVGTSIMNSMEQQFANGQPWNPPFNGGLAGGHGIPWFGYGSQGQTCLTWAQRQQMAKKAHNLVDEAYCVLTEDFVNDTTGEAANFLNMAQLKAALSAI
jgi:hypothetical protein